MKLNGFLRTWVEHQAAESGIVLEQGPLKFAARTTIGVVIVSELVTCSVQLALYGLDLLPYALLPALVVGAILSLATSASVGFLALLAIGRTLRDLAINRNEFQRLSVTDPLSGLPNRRAFFETLRNTKAGALILLDIDHFKKINDQFGHDVGDDAIRSVGMAISTALKGTPALVARIGGEEFGVVLPGQTGDAALAAALRIQKTLAAEPIVTGAGTIPLTISGGVSDCSVTRSIEQVYRSCDEALYEAKRKGRNLIIRENGLKSGASQPLSTLVTA